MSIQPPSREELAEVASTFELHLSEEEIDAFYALAEPTAAGYARLDELEDETLPVKYPRAETGHRPTAEENPSNGWSWRRRHLAAVTTRGQHGIATATGGARLAGSAAGPLVAADPEHRDAPPRRSAELRDFNRR